MSVLSIEVFENDHHAQGLFIPGSQALQADKLASDPEDEQEPVDITKVPMLLRNLAE